MAPNLIANARMYAVAPGAIAAWKRLFAWLAAESGVPLSVIDHAFPALLSELWARDDLGCAFMCGWPYLRHGSVHQVIAAPVPSADYAGGRPVYCSHFVVRADSAFRALEDTFGHRFAFTIKDFAFRLQCAPAPFAEISRVERETTLSRDRRTIDDAAAHA